MNLVKYLGLQFFEVTYMVVLVLLPFALGQNLLVFLAFLAVMSGCYYGIKITSVGEIQIDGQGVLVTGCDTGFGHHLAKKLDTMGFTVFAGCYVANGEGADSLRSSTTGRMHVISLDITSDSSVKDALSFVTSHLSENKGLWGIVNNAGLNFVGEIELCTMEMYRRVMEVNVFGMVRVTKAFLPFVRKAKGRVVNVTSVQGRLPMHSHSVYGITKAGGEVFSDDLRLEMIKFGVKVSIIEPGNFGGATGMLNEVSLKRMRRDFDTMWEEASEDVRETYGKQYLETQYTRLTKVSETTCPTLEPVTDSMVHALVSLQPKSRYLIGGSKDKFDVYCLLARLHSYLPTSWMDYLRDKAFSPGIPLKSQQ